MKQGGYALAATFFMVASHLCEDKQVSRQHGQMEVFKDSIILKVLSTNPCFLRKSGEETQILKSGLHALLHVGDRFGLLPAEHWYEVVTDPSSSGTDGQHVENGAVESSKDIEPADDVGSPDTSGTDGDNAAIGNETMPRRRLHGERMDPSSAPTANKLPRTDNGPMNNGNTSSSVHSLDRLHDNVQSAMRSDEQVRVKPDPDAPSIERNLAAAAGNADGAANIANPSTSRTNSAPSPTRCTDRADLVTVKPDADAAPSTSGNFGDQHTGPSARTPGPNSDHAASVKPDPDAAKPFPASPAKPAQPTPARERCIYGAQCYRRNPQHKAAFSHPADSDWGSGAQGVCPWGAACQRRDPRHWQHHSHPPGTQQPAPAPHRQRGARSVVVRHGNTFYIDAHAVHFHEDRFVVEDEDGDSVDYDYEF